MTLRDLLACTRSAEVRLTTRALAQGLISKPPHPAAALAYTLLAAG